METKVIQLFTDGDFNLEEGKSMYLHHPELLSKATCHCCKSVKKYLTAYSVFLGIIPVKNNDYHILLHAIAAKDPGITNFYEKIFELKCFADESKKKKENFILFDDEINKAINTVIELREYTGKKMNINSEFLADFINSHYQKKV